tara:strand:- start:232 stop:771 length:540 start_codon:yes stop_codon:yes gene_type:complete
MIRSLKKALRRFRRDENGAAILLEFVIFVPLIFSTFLMAVEMGLYSMRHMFLDRGLDMTVRYVRLNTNTDITHDLLKEKICTYSGFLDDCDSTLRLEMVPLNPRQFAALQQPVDCVDISEPVKDPRGFDPGLEHQLMILRACVKFKPIFPSTGLGYALTKDGSGRARMISTAAFVQEPN